MEACGDSLVGYCVTAGSSGGSGGGGGEGQVSLQPCGAGGGAVAKAQQWVFEDAVQGGGNVIVRSAYASATTGSMCLDGAPGGASGTNVWARKLNDTSVAFVFLNAGSAAATVACDADCFAAAGWSAAGAGDAGAAAAAAGPSSVSIRDVWAHTENGTWPLPASGGAKFKPYEVTVAGNGGSVTVIMKPE